MMKNHSNVTANLYSGDSITYIVTFEVAVVLRAIAIIISSGLVLRHIYCKVRRSRVDLLFIVLSISDIGVGSLSQTSLGISGMCSHIHCHMTRELHYSVLFFMVLSLYIFLHSHDNCCTRYPVCCDEATQLYKFYYKKKIDVYLSIFFCYNYCSMLLVSLCNVRQSSPQRSLYHLHSIQYCFVYYNHWCIYLHFTFRL